MQSITDHLDHRSAVGFYRCAHQRAMACERRGHSVTLLLPKSSTALDVGEEKSNNA